MIYDIKLIMITGKLILHVEKTKLTMIFRLTRV